MLEARTDEPLIKKILPHSFLGRSLLIIVSPLVLLQVISTWIFYESHYDTITKRLAQGLAGDIAAVMLLLDRSPTALEQDQAFHLAEEAMWLELSFQEGGVLPSEAGTKGNSLVERTLALALEERFNYPFLVDAQFGYERVVIYVLRHNGMLTVVVPSERLFSSTTYIFIAWMVGASIVLFIVAVIFMRNQVRPIKRLARAAERFGKGLDVAGFKPQGATEVRQASAAFLEMRERIKRQVRQRTEMLAGVSHDLRTPLTRMKLQLAMLGPTPEAESLQSDVSEMEQMVEGYLAFARGEGAEERQTTDIKIFLKEIIDQMRRGGRQIDLHVEQRVYLPLQREATRRALTNLISNALRYGRQVEVRAGRRKDVVEITIDDDGPGIPEEKRSEVFKPFFRMDQSRNPQTGGTGLGLTIARDVIRNHGGDLALLESPAGGLRAKIALPL